MGGLGRKQKPGLPSLVVGRKKKNWKKWFASGESKWEERETGMEKRSAGEGRWTCKKKATIREAKVFNKQKRYTSQPIKKPGEHHNGTVERCMKRRQSFKTKQKQLGSLKARVKKLKKNREGTNQRLGAWTQQLKLWVGKKRISTTEGSRKQGNGKSVLTAAGRAVAVKKKKQKTLFWGLEIKHGFEQTQSKT